MKLFVNGVRSLALIMLANLKNDKAAWAIPGTSTKSLSPFKGSANIGGVRSIKAAIALTSWCNVVAISAQPNASSVAS